MPNLEYLTRDYRQEGSDYEKSDYGGDVDPESPGFSHGLAARIDMVEALARRGLENNGTDNDDITIRVVDRLRDLGGQTSIEGKASRFVLAHES